MAESAMGMDMRDYSNRTLPFTREELQWIRDRAESMANVFGTDSSWHNAYMELASDANCLDAMLARAEIIGHEHNYKLVTPPFYRCDCGADATIVQDENGNVTMKPTPSDVDNEAHITNRYWWFPRE